MTTDAHKSSISKAGIEQIHKGLARYSFPVMALLLTLLSWRRKYVHDEFEAIKSAWKIHSGEIIYVDFFQHHHPFLYYLLNPIFSLFGESTAVTAAARLIVLLFAFGIFATTYRLARLLFNQQVASVSIVCLFAATMFVDKVIEVRPDVPQTFFGLLSIFLMFKYFASKQICHLLLSALALAMAFLFLQKILYLAVLLHILLFWRILKGQIKPSALPIFSAVFVGIWLSYCLYWLLKGELTQYLFFNFEFNLAKLDHYRYQSRELLKHFTTPYNCLALIAAAWFPFIQKSRDQRDFAILTATLLIIALQYRTQYAQYYLYILPLLAILAARGWTQLAQHQPMAIALILIAFLVASSAVYVNQLVNRQNGAQLEKIAYVRNLTGASDTVYDGDIQFNLFRRDLDFFWFGVGKGKSLDKYKKLRDYRYDIYQLIDRFKPKIISDYAIDPNHSAIRDHYVRSDRYPDIFLRRDDSSALPATGLERLVVPSPASASTDQFASHRQEPELCPPLT